MARFQDPISASGRQDTGIIRGGQTPRLSGKGPSVYGSSASGMGSAPQLQTPRLADPVNLDGFAMGMLTLADDIRKRAEARQDVQDGLWVTEQASAARSKWIAYLEESSLRPSPTLMTDLETAYEKHAAEVLLNAPSDKARSALQQDFLQMKPTIFQSGLQIRARANLQENVVAFNGIVARAHDNLSKSPDVQLLAKEQADIRAMADLAYRGGTIDAKMHASMLESADNLSVSFAEYSMAKNPELARSVITEATGISLDVRAGILAKIDRATAARDDFEVWEATESVKNNIVSLEMTGHSHPQYSPELFAATMPPEDVKSAQNHFEVASQFWSAKQRLPGATPQDVDKIVSTFVDPKSPLAHLQERYAGQLRVIADNNMRLLRDDPFAYTEQTPRMMQLAEDAQRLPPGSALHEPIFQQRIAESYSQQTANGVPPHMLSPMSMATAERIANELNYGDPNQIDNGVLGVMKTYGPYTPDAFRILQNLPSDKRIAPYISITASHLGAPWLKEFNEANRTPKGDIKLTTEQFSDVSEAVSKNDLLSGFYRSATSADSGTSSAAMASGVVGSVERWAQVMLARGSAESPRDAVEKAAEAVIGSLYSFNDVNDRTYAVAKKLTGPNGLTVTLADADIKQINGLLKLKLHDRSVRVNTLEQAEALNAQLDGRVNTAFTAKDVYTVQFADLLDSTLSQEYNDGIVNKVLSDHAFWVTDKDNEGVTLHVPGPNGTSAKVYDARNEKPISIKFLDALQQYKLYNQPKPQYERTPSSPFRRF